jgi:hypothetical protein
MFQGRTGLGVVVGSPSVFLVEGTKVVVVALVVEIVEHGDTLGLRRANPIGGVDTLKEVDSMIDL